MGTDHRITGGRETLRRNVCGIFTCSSEDLEESASNSSFTARCVSDETRSWRFAPPKLRSERRAACKLIHLGPRHGFPSAGNQKHVQWWASRTIVNNMMGDETRNKIYLLRHSLRMIAWTRGAPRHIHPTQNRCCRHMLRITPWHFSVLVPHRSRRRFQVCRRPPTSGGFVLIVLLFEHVDKNYHEPISSSFSDLDKQRNERKYFVLSSCFL